MKLRKFLLPALCCFFILLALSEAQSTKMTVAVANTTNLAAGNNLNVRTSSTVASIADDPIMGLAVFNDSPTLFSSVTTLSATITAGSNVSYFWGFGDGLSGSGRLVTHTYPAIGIYTAVLTASNSVSTWAVSTTVSITGKYWPIDRLTPPSVQEIYSPWTSTSTGSGRRL